MTTSTKSLVRVIRVLLDEIEDRDDELEARLAELESWKESVEAVWPEVVNDGTG